MQFSDQKCFRFFTVSLCDRFKVAAPGATARRTARAVGRTCRTTDKCFTGPFTRATTMDRAPCSSYRPSWAAVAHICAQPPIRCETRSSAYVRPTSNWAPTESPARVSICVSDFQWFFTRPSAKPGGSTSLFWFVKSIEKIISQFKYKFKLVI